MAGLENYQTLLQRVDLLCDRTASRLGDQLSCRPGCDACCRHLSVCAVEAAALREALEALSEADAEVILQRAEQAGPEDGCPLLQDGLCLLYRARPIICRTHGLPLLVNRDGEMGVDFCPENFRDASGIAGSEVIDLDRLNETLTAINALFLRSFPGPERLTVGQALALPIKD